jgi:hypothetical protein
MKEFRNLEASEIECRVQQVAKDNTWCTLLLYKDARVDMNLLDEVYGATNWQKTYQLIGDQLFCTISIWDSEKKCWINKQDVGVESNTEAVKGRASDAFKRACFNLGIGRELYTAPFIFIKLTANDIRNGKIKNSLFAVKSIGYNEKQEINSLVICDSSSALRYSLGSKEKVQNPQPTQHQVPQPNVIDNALEQALDSIKHARDIDELASIYKELVAFQGNQIFMSALTARKKELKK